VEVERGKGRAARWTAQGRASCGVVACGWGGSQTEQEVMRSGDARLAEAERAAERGRAERGAGAVLTVGRLWPSYGPALAGLWAGFFRLALFREILLEEFVDVGGK
jgi:hypothetical protein